LQKITDRLNYNKISILVAYHIIGRIGWASWRLSLIDNRLGTSARGGSQAAMKYCVTTPDFLLIVGSIIFSAIFPLEILSQPKMSTFEDQLQKACEACEIPGVVLLAGDVSGLFLKDTFE